MMGTTLGYWKNSLNSLTKSETKILDFQFVFQMGGLHFCGCVARHLRVLGF